MAPRSIGHKKPVRYPTTPSVATWFEVQLGSGSLDTARRICTPADDQYPNATGISFYKDGVFNRTDPTGPREDSEYHFFPTIDLVGGEELLATWTDENGVPRTSTYTVPAPEPVTTATASGAISIVGHATGSSGGGSGLEQPGPTNTGPSGTLTGYSGTYTISTNNAVIQNLDITGRMIVNADNVTVRNCRVTNTTNKYALEIKSGATGIIIEDCEIDGNEYATHALVSSNYTMRRCNVHSAGDGLRIGSNTTVEDSWIHDLVHNFAYEASPHYDCIQTLGGSNMVIRNNTLEGRYRGQTSAIIMSCFNSNVSIVIEDNYLSGGAYTLGMLTGQPYNYTSLTVTSNIFERYSSQYGPLGHYNGNKPIPANAFGTWSGNTFDTGGVVAPGMGGETPP